MLVRIPHIIIVNSLKSCCIFSLCTYLVIIYVHTSVLYVHMSVLYVHISVLYVYKKNNSNAVIYFHNYLHEMESCG